VVKSPNFICIVGVFGAVFLLAASLTACRFPGAVRPVVKLGLVAPFEGRYRYVGYDVIYAVRLAVREVNAAGGVGGYGVELIAYDDGADPALAVEQARKLAVDPAVVAAIGHFREETTRSAVSVYAEAGMSLVGPAVFTPGLADGVEGAFVYRLGPPAQVVAGAILERIEGLRLQQAEGVRTTLVTQGGPLGEAVQQLTPSALPMTLVSPEEADWVATVLASNPDVVVGDADPVTAGEVVAALRAAGWQGSFLGGPELSAADFVAVAEGAAVGALFVTPYPLPADVPGSADFAAAYREVSGGVSPGPLALPTYEAAWVVLEALAEDISAGGPTRAGIAAALSVVERDGALGGIRWDADGDWTAAPLYWYRVGEGGALSPVQF